MKLNRMLLMAGLSAVLTLGANSLVAQPDSGSFGGPGGPGAPGGLGGPGGGKGNWDPSHMRRLALERYRKTLDVKDDAQWKALETLIGKVMDARADIGPGGRGFGGPPHNRGGEHGGDQSTNNRPHFGGNASPAFEALQKAIDAKAPVSEIKSKLEAYRADGKAKEAKLEKAQEDLKAVLTPQQEAVAVLNGLLK